MANLQGFDARQQKPMMSFEALAAGVYAMMIVASEMKPTKAGTGSYLQLEFEVIDGQHKGRKAWARLNLSNPNKTAEDIANRELGAICMAIGIPTPTDSMELHSRPLLVTLGVDDGEKGKQNTFKKYEPMAGTGARATPQSQAAAPAADAQSIATAPAAPPSTPPWKR